MNLRGQFETRRYSVLGRRSRENLPLADRGTLLTEVVDCPTLLSTFTTYYSYPDVFTYPSFKCDGGVDERKSLESLNTLGQKLNDYILVLLLLEHLFYMVNMRHSVLSCRCLYDHRLGVLGVTNITMSVSVCECCVCVCGVLVCTSVFVCVCVSCGIRIVFAYNYYTYLILFFAFLYPQNLLPGLVTKPFLASVTQR